MLGTAGPARAVDAAPVSTADATSTATAPISFGVLGSIEFKTNNLSSITQWTAAVRRARRERSTYAACELRGVTCSAKVRAWRAELSTLRGQQSREQLRRLNRFINKSAVHREDRDNFKVADYWTSPMEFLDRNGDCEDFAIIKFFSLLELGFTNDQLRIVVVKDTQRNVVHAVVSVSIGGRVYLLDSLFAEPVPHEYVLHYVPVYSVNLDTRWVHFVTAQIRNQFLDQIASAVVGQN